MILDTFEANIISLQKNVKNYEHIVATACPQGQLIRSRMCLWGNRERKG